MANNSINQLFILGSGYFDFDGILPLETDLPLSFLCVYNAIITKILQVMLWCVDSAPVLKCYGSELESWLAGHVEKGSVHWRGRPGM